MSAWKLVPGNWSGSVEDYIAHYGSGCRGCADENGQCPTDQRSCDPVVNRAAYAHAIKAVEYGIAHGYLAASPEAPEDASPVTREEVALRRIRDWIVREVPIGTESATYWVTEIDALFSSKKGEGSFRRSSESGSIPSEGTDRS